MVVEHSWLGLTRQHFQLDAILRYQFFRGGIILGSEEVMSITNSISAWTVSSRPRNMAPPGAVGKFPLLTSRCAHLN